MTPSSPEVYSGYFTVYPDIWFLLLDKANDGSLGKLGFEREDCFFSLNLCSYDYSVDFTSPSMLFLCGSNKLR